mgnify:CR=1 FL=1
MGKVIATCTSEIKGVQKKNVHQVCLIEDYGIEGDAHAGKWHRQVSLLHMTGFRNSARAAQRSRTARSVKIWSWKESISRHSRSGQNLNATMSCWN